MKQITWIATTHLYESWANLHRAAIICPTNEERPIVNLISAWLDYAHQHRGRSGSSISNDGVLGPPWVNIGLGLADLLDGSLGRLDAGTLSTIIQDTLADQSYPEE